MVLLPRGRRKLLRLCTASRRKEPPGGGGESSREVAVCGAGTGKVVAEHLAGGGERAACLQRSWRCRRTLQPEGGPLAGAALPRSSRAPGAGAVTPLRGAPVAGGGQPGAHRPGGPHAGPRRPHPGNPAACSPAGRPGHRRELPPGLEMSAGPVRVSHTHLQGEIPPPSEEGGPPDSAPRPAPRPRASVPLSIDKGCFPVCCVCVWGEGLVPLPWRQAGWGGGRGGSGQGLPPPPTLLQFERKPPPPPPSPARRPLLQGSARGATPAPWTCPCKPGPASTHPGRVTGEVWVPDAARVSGGVGSVPGWASCRLGCSQGPGGHLVPTLPANQ